MNSGKLAVGTRAGGRSTRWSTPSEVTSATSEHEAPNHVAGAGKPHVRKYAELHATETRTPISMDRGRAAGIPCWRAPIGARVLATDPGCPRAHMRASRVRGREPCVKGRASALVTKLRAGRGGWPGGTKACDQQRAPLSPV